MVVLYILCLLSRCHHKYSIFQSDNQLNVSAQAKVSIPAATKISKCFKILFWCVSLKVCDEIAYYNAVLSISLTLQVNWDVTSKQLKLSVGNLSIPPTTPDVQGCHPSGIVDYFIKWHDILNEKVRIASSENRSSYGTIHEDRTYLVVENHLFP